MKARIPKITAFICLMIPAGLMLSACSDLKQTEDSSKSGQASLVKGENDLNATSAGKKCSRKKRPQLYKIASSGVASLYSPKKYDGKTCDEQLEACVADAISKNSQLTTSQANEFRFICKNRQSKGVFEGSVEKIDCESDVWGKKSESSCKPKSGKRIVGLASVEEEDSDFFGDNCRFDAYTVTNSDGTKTYYPQTFSWTSTAVKVSDGCEVEVTVITE